MPRQAPDEDVILDSSDPREPLSVSRAVAMAADVLSALPTLTMIGEVSGFRGPNARSGHCYFQVKDDAAALDCIIWKGVYAKGGQNLRDGQQLLLTGSFNLYKPTGRMSFIVRSYTLAGEGLLRQQVAELAARLEREGLMEPARKRPIPSFCTRVVVITSLSGAVIDDVKRTLKRRNPLVELICIGAKVQGEGAASELIGALARASRISPAPDCILLVRGGGSFEDLMTFNDEALARAVAASPIPVVTGIGHEPDTSICDMVSDRRASTPTAAAESVAPAVSELADMLDERSKRLVQAARAHLSQDQRALAGTDARMRIAQSNYLTHAHMMLSALETRPVLQSPYALIERRATELAQTAERLSFIVTKLQRSYRTCLDAAAAQLEALSPLKVLARGYSLTYSNAGLATSSEAFAPGDSLRVRFFTGEIYATVTETKSEA